MTEALDIALLTPPDEAYEYSQLVEKGIRYQKIKDRMHWRLGDLARQVETRYGQGTIKQFAEDIQSSANRLYEYALVASFYPIEARNSLSELNLSYTHFREAKRLGDLDKAIEFLKVTALNLWTVDQMRDALRTLDRAGHHVAKTYSEGNKIIDMKGNPPPPANVEARGLATVQRDKKGNLQLQWESAPEIEDGAKYQVFFVRIE